MVKQVKEGILGGRCGNDIGLGRTRGESEVVVAIPAKVHLFPSSQYGQSEECGSWKVLCVYIWSLREEKLGIWKIPGEVPLFIWVQSRS